jgi:hypothetical protein
MSAAIHSIHSIPRHSAPDPGRNVTTGDFRKVDVTMADEED